MTGETWGALALQSVHEASEGFALYAVPAANDFEVARPRPRHARSGRVRSGIPRGADDVPVLLVLQAVAEASVAVACSRRPGTEAHGGRPGGAHDRENLLFGSRARS